MLHTLNETETLTGTFYVMVTEHLRSPYLIAGDSDLTLAILKKGRPGSGLVPALHGISEHQREAWLSPFGVPPGGNVWDYFPPDRLLDSADIRPEHRLPPEIEARIEAYLAGLNPHRPPEPRLP